MQEVPFKYPKHKVIQPPKRHEILFLRIAIVCTTLILIQFIFWYFRKDHIGSLWLFILVSFSLGYKTLHLLYEWYYCAFIDAPPPKVLKRDYTVDILTTFVPGEPYQMIEETLKAIVAIEYPHQTILCDEGDDPYLKEFCASIGVIHSYRGKDKTGAKAGNINYALKQHGQGEIAVILDPDHIPVPEFLDRVLPYFEDEQIGFVQCVQAYGNTEENFVARGAAEQTFSFYGPLMMGMHTKGTAQAIGANCTFRRAALDSIGGHAFGLCEDMHTSMQLHAKKWTSVYVPELLTRGRVPSTLSAYYKQQLKWTRGAFELLFEVYPKLFKSLTGAQRLHYFFTPLYFFYGVIGLIDITVPILALVTFEVPLYISVEDFIFRLLPLFAGIFVIRLYAQRFLLDREERGFHFFGGVLRIGTWWVYLLGFVYALIGKKVPYIPTPKEGEVIDEWKVSTPNMVAIGVSILAFLYGLSLDWNPYSIMMSCFVLVNIFYLSTSTLFGLQSSLYQLITSLGSNALSGLKKRWFEFRIKWIYPIFNSNFSALTFFVLALLLTVQNVVDIPLANFLQLEDRLNNELVDRLEGRMKYVDIEGQSSDLLLFGDPLAREMVEQEVMSFIVNDMDTTALQHFHHIVWRGSDSQKVPFISWKLDNAKTAQALFDQTLQDTFALTAESKAFFQRVTRWMGAQRVPFFLHIEAALVDSQKVMLNQLLKEIALEEGATNLSWVRTFDSPQETGVPASDPVDVMLVYADNPNFAATYRFLQSDTLGRPVLIGKRLPFVQLTSRTSKQLIEEAPNLLGTVVFPRSSVERGLPSEHDALLDLEQSGFEETPNRVQKKSTKSLESVQLFWDAAQETYEWKLDGKPFYIKGIHYNPEESERDGYWPLTRRQLKKDFSRIVAMGANTISRSTPTDYDLNLFKHAQEYELKVIYGFPFDPEIDYLRDNKAKKQIKEDILTNVRNFKGKKALLAWKLEGDAWSDFAFQFYEPRLSKVRFAFWDFVNEIAREIKKLDPQHPIIVSLDGNEKLKGALTDLLAEESSIDVIAINAYRSEVVDEVNQEGLRLTQGRPLIIDAFGPFEAIRYGKYVRMIEPSSFEKARAYASIWQEKIKPFQGKNLGGLAYCWRDRHQESATLVGITDYKGRLKPSYYALQLVWTNQPVKPPMGDLQIKGAWDKGNFYYSLVYEADFGDGLQSEWFAYDLTLDKPIDKKELWVKQSNLVEYYSWSRYVKYSNALFGPFLDYGFWYGFDTKGIWYSPNYDYANQRVYVYLTDGQGNVVVASTPVFTERTSL